MESGLCVSRARGGAGTSCGLWCSVMLEVVSPLCWFGGFLLSWALTSFGLLCLFLVTHDLSASSVSHQEGSGLRGTSIQGKTV